MTLFKYRADRIPVLLIILLFTFDVAAYLLIDNIWLLIAYWLIMIAPKGIICAWNHHHQHLPTFKITSLNYLLEQMYALQTGATTKLWVLHHVLGHHHHYLDQTKDESRWKDKKGHIMSRMRYSLDVTLTAYYRAYQVGKRHPRPMKSFLVATAVTILVVVALTWYRPVPALLVFIIPMISSLFLTAWVTYAHHAGLDVDNDFEASYNIMTPIYNTLTGNLGYHTAHHHKQGLHWSLLPALHEKIKDKIPADLYKTEHFGSGFLNN